MPDRTSPSAVAPRRGWGMLQVPLGVLLLLMGVLIACPSGPAQAAPFTLGDVLVGQDTINDTGKVRHFSPDGTFLDVLDTTTSLGQETGMCFDAGGNLYTTNFLDFSISKFSHTGVLLSAHFIDVSPSTPNSCVFDSHGFLYVGLSDANGFTGGGGGGLLKFDVTGPSPTLVAMFSPLPEGRGTDWIDLAPDQCTLLYTSVGRSIRRFDVCANHHTPPALSGQQLPDFCTNCDDGAGGQTGPFLAFRILPGGGGVLVADNGAFTVGVIRRYDGNVSTGTGTHVKTYAGEDLIGASCGPNSDASCFFPFALNLDPDGTTFWTGDNATSEVFRFEINGAGTPLQPPFCGAEACNFFHFVTGLTVVGELTAATASPASTGVVTASITAANKIYDGTTAATITSCTLAGVLGTDNVSCTASGAAFNTASVGTGKPVSATVSLTGADANKYVLSSTTATTTANITPATVTASITAADKTYDGTAAATVTSCTLAGVIGADPVSCTTSGAAFNTASVGTGKPVSATVALTGAAAGDYVLSSTTATTTANITPAPASVTPNSASKTYGTPDPGFTGTLSGFLAGDGVTATYSRTAGETVAGSPYTISATLSPAGVLGNYAITYNTASFTINRANASVTPNAASKTYGTADPALTGTLSGFLATDGVTATYGRTAGEAVAGSPYSISATLSPAGVLGNYNVTYNTAPFTIIKADPIVAATGNTCTYNGAPCAGSGSATGVLGENLTPVTVAYRDSQNTLLTSAPVAAGTYTVAARYAGDSNYNQKQSAPATITINRANASVTPNAASKTYGAADPVVTGTLTGFLATDGVTATYSRTAGETVAGSPYTISATLSPTGVLGNYTITSNTATFSITQIAASVTPNPASKIYGTADPVLTGTLSGFLPADGVTATYSRTAGETVASSPYTISATLSPAGVLGNYAITYNTAPFTITPATPILTWADPADIVYPTPLTSVQLNATANVPGSFAYTPPAGTVLNVGPHQLLSVLFTPTDNSDYTTAAAQVHINVLPPNGGIAGTVYTDLNTNSTFDAGTDTPLAGVTITLTGTDVTGQAVSLSTVTSASGTYAFTGLVAGSYTVTAPSTASGESIETPNPLSASLAIGQSLTGVDFGYLTADVSVVKTTSAPAISVGEMASYTVVVTSNGPGTASGVVLTDVLPVGLIWTVGGPDAAACSPTSPVAGGSTLTCDFGSLASGATRTITLTGTTTLTWDFTPAADGIAGTATGADYTSGGQTLHLDAFVGSSPTANGTGAFVFGRNDGPDAMGAGVCASASGSPLTCAGPATGISASTQGLLRLDLGANLAGLGNFVIRMTSVQGSDTFDIFTNSTDTIDGATLLHSGTSADDNGAPVPLAGVQRYLFLQAATGDVLLLSLAADTCGTITNTASVSAPGDTNAANNTSAPVAITIHCPASVTPNAASKTYGAPDPPLTGALTGFHPADGVTATYSRTGGETVAGSPYTISAVLSPAGVLGNYTITYNTATFTITKADPIVVATGNTCVYSGAPCAGTGSATGVLGEALTPVTLAYRDVQNTLLTSAPVAVGTYTITARYAGDSNYNPKQSAPATITITKANASVTPNAATKTYGTADPTLTGTLTGFLAADNVTAVYSRTAGESVAGSPYTISATLSPAAVLANYDITYNTASFTITKVNASVTPNAASKTYGAADPALTGTLSGFLAADNVTATYSRTAGESVAGNPYTISATLNPAGVLGNYNVTYNTSSFTITKANASVTPNAASKPYGAADPALTGTLSGFLAADGVTATYSRTAGETVAGSPYAISATLSPTGALGNYNVTYNTASFTITKANASVTPNAASKTYGAADPALTGTLTGFLPTDGVTATYSRTAGEAVAGSPYTISATLSPAGVLANYNITYNTASFTITKASASVTPNAASKSYGAAEPTLTGTLAGFLAADNVTAAYSRTAGETVAGSPYTISATLSPAGALANYNITYNTASFTITKASASVTPNAASKTYGAADPAFTGTLSGFRASDGVTATYSRTAGETVAGSPYTISATLSPAGVLGNYTIIYNTAPFTITKASASVAPNPASKTYGTADPVLTGTLSGSLAADGVAATYSRTAGETVAGSPYTISATLSPAAALGNYTITYNTASFTIIKATASVTPNAASKTYGTADPPLTGALAGFLAADGVTATYSRTPGETVTGSPYTISATLSPAGALGNYAITYNTAPFTIKAGPITFGNSNQVSCFGVGNNIAIPVTINSQCGQTSLTTLTGNASNAITNAASGTYTITESFNNPAFSLVSPSTVGRTTTFGVNQGSTVFTFTYKNGGTTFLTGTLTFTQVKQTTSASGSPVTTGTALFTFLSGAPGFTSEWSGGGTLSFQFSFGGGEELLPLFHQTGSTGGNNWQGISGIVFSGTLTPTPR